MEWESLRAHSVQPTMAQNNGYIALHAFCRINSFWNALKTLLVKYAPFSIGETEEITLH